MSGVALDPHSAATDGRTDQRTGEQRTGEERTGEDRTGEERTEARRQSGPLRRLLRRRWLRWLLVVLAVGILILSGVSVLTDTVGAQTSNDPSSVTKTGSAAVAQLLRDQGIDLIRTDDLEQAAASANGATLVIVNSGRLDQAQLTRLTDQGPRRLVLVRPGAGTLRNLGLVATPAGSTPESATVEPSCADPLALRAGSILVPAESTGYLPVPGATACYPTTGGGVLYQQLRSANLTVDVVGAGFANRELDHQGNAAFALGLLGSEPTLVWLMAQQEHAAPTAGPALLPPWWIMLVTQVGVGLVVLAIWRGRRLGPIITERLPVVVRASETVEGHGRLYYRLSARDRAAGALRDGVRRRLGPRYGHPPDPHALAQILATRIGRDPVQVQAWLTGPAPTDDEQLRQLAHDLDRLEQEARQL